MTSALPVISLRTQLAPFSDAIANDPRVENYRTLYQLGNSSADHTLGAIAVGKHQLACQSFTPRNPLGTAILLHGYQDHMGLMSHWIDYLLGRQLTVIGCDLPGHGLSNGVRGAIDDFSEYQSVLEALLFIAKQQQLPISLIGQSTGAAIINDYLLRHTHDNFASIICLAPLVRPNNWQLINRLYKVFGKVVNKVPRKFTQNSHDQEFLDFVRYHDPLQSDKISAAWVGAMIRWHESYIQLPARKDLKPIIIQGQEDQTIDWEYNLALLEQQFPQLQQLRLPTGRHNLANETESIRKTYFEWLDQHWPSR